MFLFLGGTLFFIFLLYFFIFMNLFPLRFLFNFPGTGSHTKLWSHTAADTVCCGCDRIDSLSCLNGFDRWRWSRVLNVIMNTDNVSMSQTAVGQLLIWSGGDQSLSALTVLLAAGLFYFIFVPQGCFQTVFCRMNVCDVFGKIMLQKDTLTLNFKIFTWLR